MPKATHAPTTSRRFLLGAAALAPMAALALPAASAAVEQSSARAATPAGGPSILAMGQRIHAIMLKWDALDAGHRLTAAEQAEQERLETEREELVERVLSTPALTLADCAVQAATAMSNVDVTLASDHGYAIRTGRLDDDLTAFRFAFASILRQVSAASGVPVDSIAWPDARELRDQAIREGRA